MQIPSIIHQIWEGKTDPLPDFFCQLGETWKRHHPSWQYILWDKAKMDQFIRDYYPDFIPIYEDYRYDVQRWDVIRYMILYQMGGVYADFDYECLEPLDELLEGKYCCFGTEPEEHARLFNKPFVISNAFMSSIPGHPFMKRVLEAVKKPVSTAADKLSYVLETTGPHMLLGLYEQYSHKEELTLFPAEIISPFTKMEVDAYVNGTADVEVLEKKMQKAVAIHYFWGSWC